MVPVKYAYKSSLTVYDQQFNSDHKLISLLIEFRVCNEKINHVPKWKTHKADWELYQELAESNFNYEANPDINEHEEQFVKTLNNIATKSIPKTKATGKKQTKYVPWWNRECELAIRHRETARKNYAARKTEHNEIRYTEAKKQVKDTILNAKRKQLARFCKSNRN